MYVLSCMFLPFQTKPHGIPQSSTQTSLLQDLPPALISEDAQHICIWQKVPGTEMPAALLPLPGKQRPHPIEDANQGWGSITGICRFTKPRNPGSTVWQASFKALYVQALQRWILSSFRFYWGCRGSERMLSLREDAEVQRGCRGSERRMRMLRLRELK